MEKITISKDDIELNEAFELILSTETYSDYISDIAEMIYKNKLDSENLQAILDEYSINKIEDIKEEILDILIAYIHIILNDHKISEKESNNLKILKRFFKIREGDFYKYRFDAIREILQRQFERMYRDDNKIDSEEAILKVGLQELFDLGYDQFLVFQNREAISALERGANIEDLDTVLDFTMNDDDFDIISNRAIPQEVKDMVWNRDRGKCVQCGSSYHLEFDHIIPFSKGGSNTYRNIQLLCETCNRKKSNNIG